MKVSYFMSQNDLSPWTNLMTIQACDSFERKEIMEGLNE